MFKFVILMNLEVEGNANRFQKVASEILQT